MLEKPQLEEEKIIHCLKIAYGLHITRLAFLPLGGDLNTAVYRAVSKDSTIYLVKLRRGEFAEASVTVPKYLNDQGMQEIIPPLPTSTGQLWADFAPFKLILHPFVEGQHGFERNLSDRQWVEFGSALKCLHTTAFPQAITSGIPSETFSTYWRNMVKGFIARIQKEEFAEPTASETAAFLKIKSNEILELVERAECLAQMLHTWVADFIVCHGDIHAWNFLVTDRDDFYMVDWDTLIFAPKERDLMFIGAGLGGGGHTPQEEKDLFYQGYGTTDVDREAIAYYRYERIIEDIAVFCEQILVSEKGGEDREQALIYLKSNFLPEGVLERARQAEAMR